VLVEKIENVFVHLKVVYGLNYFLFSLDLLEMGIYYYLEVKKGSWKCIMYSCVKSINFSMIACPFMIGEIIRLRGNRLSFGLIICKLSSNSSPRDFSGLSQILNVFHCVKRV
jgi:hypothetical protein